ncbi:MAG: hypothetical protein KKC79_20535 [Gammaproteobacteria bacterium]|nr:hypothetical protein [Gammaproteobacteria bacterium]MBU1442988.1 hypothetical protein [Gammaproteobacteria bacterium]MBU2285428.1 hypothetical protein [Gammaproteobacteria bacterium]MBU2411024.1 hypothetical protein [Gammaproteobacteria bacterium]
MSDSSTPEDTSVLVRPKFGGVVLVCKECQKRSSGPSKLKAKALGREFKRESIALETRLRVVQCSCLGLCPKKAITVVGMVGDRPLRMAKVRHEDDVKEVVAAMRQASPV